MSELPEFEKLQNIFKELLKGQLARVGSAKKKKKKNPPVDTCEMLRLIGASDADYG